jgi:hypothetical protein
MRYYLRTFYAIFKTTALDIAVGILLAHVLIKFFHYQDLSFFAYFWGVVFALLPDMDTMFVFRKEKLYADHRSWPHYPLLMFMIVLPIVAIYSYLFVGFISFFYLSLAFGGLLWHYLHDSWDNIENQEGVQWGAPFFSYNRYVISVNPSLNNKKGWFVLTGYFVKRVADKTIQRMKERKETAMEFWEKHYMKETWDAYQGVVVLFVAILIVWLV